MARVRSGFTGDTVRAVLTVAAALLALAASVALGIAADDEVPGVVLPASPVSGSLTTTENPYALDVNDVYAVRMSFNDRLEATLAVPAAADFDLYLFAPGTKSVASALQPPYSQVLTYSGRTSAGADESLGYVWDRSQAATCYVDVKQWAGSGPYTLTWRRTRLATPSVVSTTTPVVGYGRSAIVTGTVTSAGGWPLSGLRVMLLANAVGDPEWTIAAQATSTASGGYTVAAKPVRQTRYRVKTQWATSSRGEVVGWGYGPMMTVVPQAYLSLWAPESVTRARTFTAKGTLKPSHAAATGHVAVGAWRRTAAGTWQYYRTFPGRCGGTEWSAAVALPTSGRWFLRAVVYADESHAKTLSVARNLVVR